MKFIHFSMMGWMGTALVLLAFLGAMSPHFIGPGDKARLQATLNVTFLLGIALVAFGLLGPLVT